MAKFEIMIPFILHFAAGVYGENGKNLRLSVERQFELARKTGWSDDPDDPGGATMIDVTLSTYTVYRKDKGLQIPTKAELREISFLEWKEILKTMYWDKWKADTIHSQGIANILTDWSWTSGTSVIRKVQNMIGVNADGIVGPITLSAINTADQDDLFRKLMISREEYYRSCRAAWKYLKGWLRRLHAILPDGSFHLSPTLII